MGLYSGGLINERIFASEIWGAYFRTGLFFFLFFFWGGGGGGGLIIGILRSNITVNSKLVPARALDTPMKKKT